MTLNDLPALNASLSALSAILLIFAYIAIKRRNIRAHVTLVSTTILATLAFLVSYLIYHYNAPAKPFPIHTQPIRATYYLILFTHIPLAMLLIPLIAWSLIHALRRKWRLHRAVARPTFWIWMYVSVTGVIVYTMLYQLPGWLGEAG